MGTIETARVEDVMVTTLITVDEMDKMEEVAQVFKQKDIHAAPVLDKDGKCVGIITSHDLVDYESVRQVVQTELSRGTHFNMARYGRGLSVRWPGPSFGEVGFHMTKEIEPANPHDKLSAVAKVMCAKHRHHVVVLDERETPIGIVSTLDLLGFLVDQPVSRTASADWVGPAKRESGK